MRVRIGDIIHDADTAEVRDVPGETRMVILVKDGKRHGFCVDGMTYDLEATPAAERKPGR